MDRKRNRDERGSSGLSDSIMGSTKKKMLVDEAETDELMLRNEQLEDESRSLKDEIVRNKEKYARQLTCMEEENAKMKKVATDIKDKYYEEKKKWQAKLREASKNANTSTSILNR